MVTKVYVEAAHRAVSDSYRANEQGEYLESWKKTVPARLNYLADAVINTPAVPYYLIKAGYGTLKAAYSWGRETNCLTENLQNIDQSLGRILFGSIGAVLSPAAAKSMKDTPFSVAALLTAYTASLAAIAVLVVAAALFVIRNVPSPNAIFYNPTIGFTLGWSI